MPEYIRSLLLISMCLTLIACEFWGNKRDAAPVMKTPIVEYKSGDWFCQVNEAGDNWDCVQNHLGAKSPIPARFTKPLQAEPVPTATLASVDTSGSSRLDPLQVATDLADDDLADAEVPTTVPTPPNSDGYEPVPEAGGAPPEVATDKPHVPVDAMPPKPAHALERNPASAKLPEWQRLAYRPAVPVALRVLPAHFYAVQIVAMSSKEGLEIFSKEHLLSGASAVRVESDGEFYYVLLLGIYETLAGAKAAAASRPDSLMIIEPWIRMLGSLQDAVVRADKLAGTTDF